MYRTLSRLVALPKRTEAQYFLGTAVLHANNVPVLHSAGHPFEGQDPYWKKVPRWRETGADRFVNHKWQMGNSVQSKKALCEFLTTTDMAPHLRITDIYTAAQQLLNNCSTAAS
ncbi:hypothetical protein OCS_00852 [Ophiocordyceps sinensis CO18]|uniref:Uncharacterized protein n=1 Tax=Ophiocordyceps sinensis (strain Co18 / CGMCC 3.14243) TaxID=911162 RepID=T5ANV7_OPHSC|nr:hypothetical protein OCS_00852 [Ophiocordyceps sinensis CO18]